MVQVLHNSNSNSNKVAIIKTLIVLERYRIVVGKLKTYYTDVKTMQSIEGTAWKDFNISNLPTENQYGDKYFYQIRRITLDKKLKCEILKKF